MKTHNYEHWIETYLGHPIDPINPEKHRIYHMDIAHHLSNQCRFSGATKSFYSVAQHSVHVSELVERWGGCPESQMLALFHDASEAYLVDMPTPIKRQMPAYRDAEAKLQTMIEQTLFFDFKGQFRLNGDRLTKKADIVLLATEARDLMNDPKDWKVLQGVEPLKKVIEPLLPNQAKIFFLNRYQKLLPNFSLREARK